MTREEAIKIIDCYDIGFYDLSGEHKELIKALNMAIEALQEVDELERIIRELADEDYQRQLWRDYKSLL